MTRDTALAAAISAPSIGPTILVVFGLKVPVAALILALVGLLLARYVKPKSAGNLSPGQERALTMLLALILFVIVIGEFPYIGDGEPLGVGMGVAWGVGLGTSGLLAVDLIGSRIVKSMRALLGLAEDDKRKG